MTRFRIEKTASVVVIELTDVGDKRDALLSAFNECAEGRCSCPTTEYKKVASMQVENGADQIEIELEPKPGSDLYVSEIASCLAQTINAGDLESNQNRPSTSSAT